MSESASWLLHDHRRYEMLLAEVKERVGLEDWRPARRVFQRLRIELRRHVRLENEVLYPAYEALPDAPRAPTAALRHEHDDIVRLLDHVAAVLESADSAVALESLQVLERAVTLHHDVEESLFLPMAGHVLLARRAEVLRRLEAHERKVSDEEAKR